MKRLGLVATLLGGLVAAAPVVAAYPEKPITLIVPFVAGGSSDIVARAVGPKLSESLGQQVVIENRPGANGSLAGGMVAKAKPDGYTFMVGSIGVFSINPVLYKNLQYDPQKDMDLLTLAVRTPNALVASPKFPASTVAELIAHAKKNPDKISYASSGTGSSDHLSAALFWQKTGTTGIHVPYKGGAAAINDLIGGHADVSFQNLGAVANHIRNGNLKLLALTAEGRHPAFPDTPVMKETGVDGLVVYSWQAFTAPKGLPKEVTGKLQPALVNALKAEDTKKRLADIGFDVVANSPEEFGQFLAGELARWKQVVDTGNIKVDD
jgi:tripartite-type tricarboxylate transporter receptor subunit TctC